MVFGNVLAIIVERLWSDKWRRYKMVFQSCLLPMYSINHLFHTWQYKNILLFVNNNTCLYNIQAINQRDNMRANNRYILEAWQNGTQSISLQSLNGNDDVIHMVSIFQKKIHLSVQSTWLRSAAIYKEEENWLKWHGWMDRCHSCSRKSFHQSQLRWSMVLLLSAGCCKIDKRPLIRSRW